jgi:hypothetical protein
MVPSVDREQPLGIATNIARRQVLQAIALAFPFACLAQTYSFAPWHKIPAVTVVWTSDDARVQLVRDAVVYWNGTLGQIGTPFRLGPVSLASGTLPSEELRAISAQVVGRGGWRPEMPEDVGRVAGDLVVALSDGEFISFGITWPARQKALVAIQTNRVRLLMLPNVERNVVAHELGHAIGLGHNSDPAMLMCGRPAACRPDAFTSPNEHYFPLSEREVSALRAMYPAGWPA